MGTTLQKLNEVPGNEVSLCAQPRPSEALRPLLVSVHPCTRDVLLCPLIVEVVCHGANRHKVEDGGFNIRERRIWGTEQESVTCQPDPFLQDPNSIYRFRCVPEIECCDGP